MTYDQIRVGDNGRVERTITKADVAAFAGVTGDFNPVHMDEEYARGTRFGRRITHGMFAGSLFSAIFTNQIPGHGNIYISQSLFFHAPVFIGDTITAKVTVVEKMEKGRVRFTCVVTNEQGEPVVSGEAVCLPPKG